VPHKKIIALHVAERRVKVAELYLHQKTQSEIAQIVGVNQGTVSTDLKAIQKQWRESAIVDLNEAKRRELERIDQVERAAWDSYERSLNPVIVMIERSESRNQAKRETQETTQAGDPRFLSIIQKCIEQRIKLLGLQEPDVQVNVEVRDYREEINSRLSRLATAGGQRESTQRSVQ
jgi:DNA-binding transcriptional regulator LsrR (DeoR family)